MSDAAQACPCEGSERSTRCLDATFLVFVRAASSKAEYMTSLFSGNKASEQQEDTAIANNGSQDEGGDFDGEDLEGLEGIDELVRASSSWLNSIQSLEQIFLKPSEEDHKVAFQIYRQLVRQFIREKDNWRAELAECKEQAPLIDYLISVSTGVMANNI